MMRGNWIGWSAIGLATAALLLVFVNVALALFNSRLQAQVATRQQFVSEAPGYRQVGEALVRSVNAALAATKDPQLAAMMQRHGLSTTAAPAAAGSAPQQPETAPTRPTGKTR